MKKKIVNFRRKIDKVYLLLAGFFLALWIRGLESGVAYVPGGKASPSRRASMVDDPQDYYLYLGLELCAVLFFIFLALVEFPRLRSWHYNFMETQRIKQQNAKKISIALQVILFIVMPIVFVTALLFLAAYLGRP